MSQLVLHKAQLQVKLSELTVDNILLGYRSINSVGGESALLRQVAVSLKMGGFGSYFNFRKFKNRETYYLYITLYNMTVDTLYLHTFLSKQLTKDHFYLTVGVL